MQVDGITTVYVNRMVSARIYAHCFFGSDFPGWFAQIAILKNHHYSSITLRSSMTPSHLGSEKNDRIGVALRPNGRLTCADWDINILHTLLVRSTTRRSTIVMLTMKKWRKAHKPTQIAADERAVSGHSIVNFCIWLYTVINSVLFWWWPWNNYNAISGSISTSTPCHVQSSYNVILMFFYHTTASRCTEVPLPILM